MFKVKSVCSVVMALAFESAIAELRNATITSSCLSVRPSVLLSARMEQLSSHLTDFHEI
jgi:hypothetical protein